MGEEEKPFERIPPIRPGDEVLRRRRKRHKLRVAPNVPRFFRFLKDAFSRTPLLQMVIALGCLILAFSAGFYFVEHGTNPAMGNFGDALFWTIVSMQTMGSIGIHPITGAGHTLTAIWAFVGTATFWGVIIATVTAYFMLPRRRPSTEIAATIQYNLEKLDDLSVDELEVLKGATDRLIEVRMERLRREAPTK